jgi:hypothetical protein
VKDSELHRAGPGGVASKILIAMSVNSKTLDFISGSDLNQRFDIHLASDPQRPGAPGGALGTVTKGVGSTVGFFAFVIDRLRATPKVCHAS